MALANAEKQRRWRDKRNALAGALTGKPKEIADNILLRLGADQAKKVARALEKRLRNIKPDCPGCHGTGFVPYLMATPCGMPIVDPKTGQQTQITLPCDCSGRPPIDDPIKPAMPLEASCSGQSGKAL